MSESVNKVDPEQGEFIARQRGVQCLESTARSDTKKKGGGARGSGNLDSRKGQERGMPCGGASRGSDGFPPGVPKWEPVVAVAKTGVNQEKRFWGGAVGDHRESLAKQKYNTILRNCANGTPVVALKITAPADLEQPPRGGTPTKKSSWVSKCALAGTMNGGRSYRGRRIYWGKGSPGQVKHLEMATMAAWGRTPSAPRARGFVRCWGSRPGAAWSSRKGIAKLSRAIAYITPHEMGEG